MSDLNKLYIVIAQEMGESPPQPPWLVGSFKEEKKAYKAIDKTISELSQVFSCNWKYPVGVGEDGYREWKSEKVRIHLFQDWED